MALATTRYKKYKQGAEIISIHSSIHPEISKTLIRWVDTSLHQCNNGAPNRRLYNNDAIAVELPFTDN